MPRAAIALGSNLGDRLATLHSAVHSLADLGTVIAISEFVETAPVGYVDQPAFLNGAAVLSTALDPYQLLTALLEVEIRYGTRPSHGIDKGPRTLDLDLLLYGRPRAADRRAHVAAFPRCIAGVSCCSRSRRLRSSGSTPCLAAPLPSCWLRARADAAVYSSASKGCV